MHAAEPVPTDSFRHDWRAGSAFFRAALVGVALIALAIRLYHLKQPMRLDEARTFLDYVIRPLPDAVSNYMIPNNHLVHTVLAWISVRVFGNAEWAVRLPAFIAGLAIVPATYVATRAIGNRGAALIAAALTAVLPGLILYTTNARGYSMVCLAFVLLIPVADALATKETAARWFTFGLLMALGVATIPVMLYPGGAVVLWLLAERVRRQNASSLVGFALRLAGVLAVAGVVAMLAYLPAIQRFGAGSLTGNKFVAPHTWSLFFQALPQFVQRLRDTIGLGISDLLAVALALVGLFPLVMRGRERGKLFTLALATALSCVVLLLLTRRAPPPRVWLFLAPLGCMYVGIGWTQLASWLSPKLRVADHVIVATAALLLAIGIGGATVVRRTIFQNDESVGFIAGAAVAEYMLAEARPGDRVVTGNFVSPEVDYYLFVKGGKRFGDLEAPSRSDRVLFILNERQSQTTATVQAERPDVDWSKYAVPVQLRKFELASVWEAQRLEKP